MRNIKGQFEKHGENLVEFIDDYAVIWTVDKKGNKKVSYKIDIDDVTKVLQYRWSVGTDGYAKCRSLKMHRLILNAQSGQIVDHINQDVTDNRKSNLRFVSFSLNMRNSNKTNNKSGHKHIIKQGNKFSIMLRCRGRRYYICGIKTLEEAIQQRNSFYEKIKYFEE